MVFRDRICGFALLAIGALGGVSAHPAKKTWSGGAGAGAGNTTGALPVVDLKYALQRATSYNVSYLAYYSIFLILLVWRDSTSSSTQLSLHLLSSITSTMTSANISPDHWRYLQLLEYPLRRASSRQITFQQTTATCCE
jgi:hypothetical protein